MAADEKHLIAFSQGARDSFGPTKFTGYDTLSGDAKILALSNGAADAVVLKEGETGIVVLDSTPFYGEGGGQVGDQGVMKTANGHMKIHDVTKRADVYLHHVEIITGSLSKGEKVSVQVDESERRRTQANHSATHLMHSALRKVLGAHVGQAGSVVDPDRLRFDFTHNKPMTAQEIAEVERLVNEQISRAVPVQTRNMKHKDAIAAGAIAMFGEKYGDEVRVLSMGDFSTELCGGTHVSNTAQIRVFKIMSEGGVSAGVRRIEAMTGDGAVAWLMDRAASYNEALNASGSKDLRGWIEAKKDEVKSLEKEIKKLRGGTVNVDDLAGKATSFKSKSGQDAKAVFADVDLDDRDVLAQLADQLKNKLQKGVVVVVGKGDGSNPIIVAVSKELNADVKAGDVLKEIAGAMGGKGGGRPDFAQGAAPDRSKIGDAKAALNKVLGI